MSGYKPGDAVKHVPSGETWTVAAPSPDGTEIVCCGWPESIAKASDCEMASRCHREEAVQMAMDVAKGTDLRASWARHWLASQEVKA